MIQSLRVRAVSVECSHLLLPTSIHSDIDLDECAEFITEVSLSSDTLRRPWEKSSMVRYAAFIPAPHHC